MDDKVEMNVVLIHIGPDMPDYMPDCMEQVRRFFPGKIHAILPDKYICHNFNKRIGIHPVAYESIQGDSLYQEFQRVCFLEGFWNVTMARFIMLEILIRRKNLKDVVHIENDVLIYRNPAEMLHEFHIASGSSVLLTPVGDNYASGAYLFVRNASPLKNLNTLFIQHMKKGRAEINKLLGTPDPTEMMLLSLFWKKFESVIRYLPIVPEGKGGQRFSVFGTVFDGASAGQYIGGTRSDGPGWTGQHHWLGRDIQKGKYGFEWTKNIKGLRVPVMVDLKKKKNYLMNNLHIHCKRLREYM